MATSKIRQAFQAGISAMKAHRDAGPTEIVVPPRHGPQPDLQSSLVPPPPENIPAPAPLTIRTSEKDWLARLTEAYRQHSQVELIDDAGAGIDLASPFSRWASPAASPAASGPPSPSPPA
jgi:hypothetical protein